eukprot:CAMPEP_0201509704 /NCGR_PEP_ID=MMETSP0161_2-20130828/2672_1 /ASSEMBLY_ACC=CAM_ASM_000251 /TAXON_ID=180227 /ORGANISM="Neoparamoeba aestuarina, Strain SoJaBio B1-5/56/2" /LENGTH=675 /DNA_ID=CAMNT_0047904731 /DNA_START=564 /DNA_END=2591 /DNA_ORIENTATION=-
MDLSFNQLSGTLPTEIGNLSELWQLELDHNPLHGYLPTELGLLSNLQILNINLNHDNDSFGEKRRKIGKSVDSPAEPRRSHVSAKNLLIKSARESAQSRSYAFGDPNETSLAITICLGSRHSSCAELSIPGFESHTLRLFLLVHLAAKKTKSNNPSKFANNLVASAEICSVKGNSLVCPKAPSDTLNCLNFQEWLNRCFTGYKGYMALRFAGEGKEYPHIVAGMIYKGLFAVPQSVILSPNRTEMNRLERDRVTNVTKLLSSAPGLIVKLLPLERLNYGQSLQQFIQNTILPTQNSYLHSNKSTEAYFPFEKTLNYNIPFRNAKKYWEQYGPTVFVLLQLHSEKIAIEGHPLRDDLTSLLEAFATIKHKVHISVLTEQVKNAALQLCPDAVVIVRDNRGMDIGGFMAQVEHLVKSGEMKRHDLIFKWHTKTNPFWRRFLSEPFDDKVELKKSVIAFSNHPRLGMLGSSSACLKLTSMLVTPLEELHERVVAEGFLTENLNEFDLSRQLRDLEQTTFKRTSTFKERDFVGGTIFMVRAHLMEKLYNQMGKEWKELVESSPLGYVKSSPMHSMERFMGYAVRMMDYEVHCSRLRFPSQWFFHDLKDKRDFLKHWREGPNNLPKEKGKRSHKENQKEKEREREKEEEEEEEEEEENENENEDENENENKNEEEAEDDY